MNSRKVLHIVIDIAMAGVLVAVMATALVQEAPHEWLGVSLFALMIVHIVCHRKWLVSIFRGRHDVLRIVQIVVLVGLAVCIIGQLASSLVLSKHAFGFLPALPGASWARRAHMLCSYWMFMLAFAHAGLHIRVLKNIATWQLWAIRVCVVLIACFGIMSFFQLNLPAYLAGQIQFAAADFSSPIIVTLARYASIAVLVAAVFHCIRMALDYGKRQRKRAE